MKFIFRVAFYVTALLMAWTMFGELTDNGLPGGAARGARHLIYGGELRPYAPLPSPSSNVEFLLENPELIYDMTMSRLRANSLNAPAPPAPVPEILFDEAGAEPRDLDSIILPRSLIQETPSTDETVAPAAASETPPDSAESARSLKLLGVISGRNGKLALINNQIWEEGDWLEGYKIIRIKNGKVMMENKNGDIFILGM